MEVSVDAFVKRVIYTHVCVCFVFCVDDYLGKQDFTDVVRVRAFVCVLHV